MLKLYQLAENYGMLMDIIDRTDATEDDFKLTLGAILDEFDQKVGNIAHLCLSLDATSEAIGGELSRLITRRVAAQNKVKWLKDYVLAEMISLGKQQIKRDTVTVSVRTNNPSVVVFDPTELPGNFIREVPAFLEVDKKSILEHFKSTGEIPPGVDIVTDKKRLDIR